METAFGILLFVFVYGCVAYIIYDYVTGERSRGRPRAARIAKHRGTTAPAQQSLSVLARHRASHAGNHGATAVADANRAL